MQVHYKEKLTTTGGCNETDEKASLSLLQNTKQKVNWALIWLVLLAGRLKIWCHKITSDTARDIEKIELWNCMNCFPWLKKHMNLINYFPWLKKRVYLMNYFPWL